MFKYTCISQQRVPPILVQIMAAVQGRPTHKGLHATVLQSTLVIHAKIKLVRQAFSAPSSFLGFADIEHISKKFFFFKKKKTGSNTANYN